METNRLILRDYEETDLNAYFQLKSDLKTMYYLQDIQLVTAEEAKVDFQKVWKDLNSSNRTLYFFHMERKDTHEQVGSISAGFAVRIS